MVSYFFFLIAYGMVTSASDIPGISTRGFTLAVAIVGDKISFRQSDYRDDLSIRETSVPTEKLDSSVAENLCNAIPPPAV